MRARSTPWPRPESSPGFGDPRFTITSRRVLRNGVPVLPVSGELHHLRVPRADWSRRLRLMRAGGITAVSTYVFWLWHQPVPGPADFDGQLDVASFVAEAEAADLDVVIRIGPWCHGETRNGGFPDWVQQAPVQHRTNDPAYLRLVDDWFSQLGAHLSGVLARENRVIAIQLENELYDQPDHIAMLQRIATDHGLVASVYTSTAWGSAALPKGLVVPLYGGYADGFWVDSDSGWDASFREHFFHSHVWDDPGIGADLRTSEKSGTDGRFAPELYPPATCELGGGMTVAYHRRPTVSGRDIAAVAHAKIGNGSAWQGYYMFVGGANPPGTQWQESHATGYPNDLPRFDYDFHAPIGAAGDLREAFGLLREQHTFLRDFGGMLTGMPSALPETMPKGLDDRSTLRWALRSDGRRGVVFMTWHQPLVPLADVESVQFDLQLCETTVRFPDRPVTVRSGTTARWPVNLDFGGIGVDWATASLIALTDGRVPLLVLGEEEGILGQVRFAGGVDVTEQVVGAERPWQGARLLRARSESGALDVLIIPFTLRGSLTVTPTGRVILAVGAVVEDGAVLTVEESDGTRPAEFCADSGEWVGRGHSERSTRRTAVVVTAHDPAAEPPATYGQFKRRASAPSSADVRRYGARWELDLRRAIDGDVLTISWMGDVAQLAVDGIPVADQFWNGSVWRIPVDRLAAGSGSRVELRVLPGHPESRVGIGYDGRSASLPVTAELDEAVLVSTARWRIDPASERS
nr:beta-galactosidase [Planctomonas sp. JC2975]